MNPPETILESSQVTPSGSRRPTQREEFSTPPDLTSPRMTDNARIVLAKRYLIKDETGAPVESPRDLFWRVARVIAAVDGEYGADTATKHETAERFYNLMAEGIFVPNSPTLMNAGRPLGQLSACFVLPVPDSLEGIYETLRDMALIHQSGGGTGFGFSRVRGKGDVVNSTMGVASGPVSFMEVYDASTEAVKQGGTRRGANMGILRVDHPDILHFIDCKKDNKKITNFNISVGVTDAFMQAVSTGGNYELLCPRSGGTVGTLNAAEVFDQIIEGAWRNGEPGVFFIDEANRYNPVPRLGSYEATNPCGEQPLLAHDVCNLGSINVGYFVDDTGEIDWAGLRNAIHESTHFLDNVIDANRYPLPRIEELSQKIRRIGLGIMGWADFLVKIGEPYGTERATELGQEVMAFLDEEAKTASEHLAVERGVFPEWQHSIWGPDETCARDENGSRIRPERLLRNCNVTTVAPTGTISIIAGCSSGIEPLFAVAFMRNQAGVLMPDVNPEFVRRAKRDGWYSEPLMTQIADEGHIHFDEVPEGVQRIFVTAHDVNPEQHVRTQAAFQAHCDSAISKTCNFPNEATKQDVREIYELAFALKCKGVTVYRDGSRDEQVLSTGQTAKDVERQASESGSAKREEAKHEDQPSLAAVSVEPEVANQLADLIDRLEAAESTSADLTKQNRALEAQAKLDQKRITELEGAGMQRRQRRRRPSVLRGVTRQIESPLGTMYVTINEDDQRRPFEVFVAIGKTGGAAMADAEAIGRLCSLALRSGITLREVHKQLRGISSDRAVGIGPKKVLSGPDAVAQVIERYLEEQDAQHLLPIKGLDQTTAGNGLAAPGSTGQQEAIRNDYHAAVERNFIGVCGDCGSSLIYEEGCAKCYACGFSECG